MFGTPPRLFLWRELQAIHGIGGGATYKRLRFSEVLAAAGQRVEWAKQRQQHYDDEGAGTGSAT